MEHMSIWMWAVAAATAVLLYVFVPAIRRQADREVHDMINDPVRTLLGSLAMALIIFGALGLVFWVAS